MKSASFLILVIIFLQGVPCLGQECIFRDSLLNIDFGTAGNPQDFNLSQLRGYREVNNDCPDNATFSFAVRSQRCFDNHWFSLPTDHTPGSSNGRMMIVNSASRPEAFFTARLAGFKASTPYELGVWMMNICRVNEQCTDMLPSVSIILKDAAGLKLVEFRTGPMAQTMTPLWIKFSGLFETSSDPGLLTLTMTTLSSGVCGNDFAMDDITVRECYSPTPPPPITRVMKTVPNEEISPGLPKVAAKNGAKSTGADPKLSKRAIEVKSLPSQERRELPATVGVKALPVPEPLKTRTNMLVKRMLFPAGDIFIELYDNGIVDGDTVSIYDNNALLVSRAGLSEKPVRLKLNLQPGESHHELIMVAENLGSIPPNTSLMVLSSKGKREEVFISSSEQKNAKLVIDLLE